MTYERRQFLRASITLGFASLIPVKTEGHAKNDSTKLDNPTPKSAEATPTPEELPYYYHDWYYFGGIH